MQLATPDRQPDRSVLGSHIWELLLITPLALVREPCAQACFRELRFTRALPSRRYDGNLQPAKHLHMRENIFHTRWTGSGRLVSLTMSF
jgi:hypothetical protein